MARVYVNIGSNLGQKKENLVEAIELIGREFGETKCSEFVESEAWGFDSTNSFLNIGISFESTLNPHEVLKKLLGIEKSICGESHRNADGTYRDRLIDIDIMAIDGEIINTPELQVPHRHLHERVFFLYPMQRLNPGWLHPKTGKTLDEMLQDIGLR